MTARLRVAAYCRVSTDQADQLHSLAAQQQYFTELIAAHPEWEPAGIWADEGLSGTSTAKRRQFRALMAAAERGEIDLILTKEVSRFARNTVDTLEYTRKLRGWGVGVLFLNDNIDTRAGEGEFRLTIMASVAQEESRKTSERVKWGQRRSMEHGVVFGAPAPYGYRLEKGVLSVREEQAKTVRRIYSLFLDEGQGTHTIARRLTEAGVPTPRANGNAWSSAMVLRLLRNEKYCGDLLQKKTCTPDFLTHRKVRNCGLEEQIYLRDHHTPIVSREQFAAVQQELARRRSGRTRHSARYWCSGKARCGACGRPLSARRSVHRDGTEQIRWVCRHCGAAAGSIREEELLCCVQTALQTLQLDVEHALRAFCTLWRAAERQEGVKSPDAVGWERRRGLLRQQLLMAKPVYAHTVRLLEIYQDAVLVSFHGTAQPVRISRSAGSTAKTASKNVDFCR